MRIRPAGTMLLALILATGPLPGCGRDRSPRPLAGSVRFQGREAPGVRVEVFLEAGRFAETPPFAAGFTDENGHFSLNLPPGHYWLVARAEDPGRGRLFGEFPGNPADLSAPGGVRGAVIELSPAATAWEYRGAPDSGVEGTVSAGGRPAEGAFVYVYEGDATGLRGPGYLTAARVDAEGRFRVQLDPGRYFVAARRKGGEGKSGFVGSGDWSAVFQGNPVTVTPGSFRGLGTLVLHPADQTTMEGVAAGRRERQGSTGLAGLVLDRDGHPRAGMHVILYDHPQMIGRPRAMTVSDDRGGFILSLPEGGEFWLGARQNRSGPRSPGEVAGGYEGTPDHSVSVPAGKWLEGLVIRVEEVW